MAKKDSKVSNKEFISIMALLMSLTALSIDVMLPALSQIGASLGVENPNDNQLVVTSVFFGMALGFMLYGPFSDAYGRKKAIYLGVSIFLFGSVISILSTNIIVMLIGRLVQGLGVASCRIVTIAMIRDKFEGREMARVMSLIMLVFVVVPIIAPSIGQVILLVSGWRSIFLFIFAVGMAGCGWLYFRQPETLDENRRLSFSLVAVLSGVLEAWEHPVSRGYAISLGLVYGAFIGYLSSAQQILQVQYELGDMFSIYFGVLALSIAFSFFCNSKLVMILKIEKLCQFSLLLLICTSILFYFYAQSVSWLPGLYFLMGYLLIVFFCLGLLFGNLNVLAMQPLGHIAGVASSVIGFIQILLAIAVGGFIGHSYNGTVQPLVLGFLICGTGALVIILRIRN